jgi:hypothetical protein
MALAGTVLTDGEVIEELPHQYIEMYQKIFPNLPVAGRPLDIWENDPYMLWGMAPGNADGPYELFGIFNLKDENPETIELNLDEISARCYDWYDRPQTAPDSYLLWDFWAQKLFRSEGPILKIDKPLKDCHIFALRAEQARPQLLGSSGHFSCGVVETKNISWNAETMTLSGKARGNGGDPTTLFFHVPDGTKLRQATFRNHAARTTEIAPHVLTLDIPAGNDFYRFKLIFEGLLNTPKPTRKFKTGRTSVFLCDLCGKTKSSKSR